MRHDVDMTIPAYESVDMVYGHLALTFSIGRVGSCRPSYDRRGTHCQRVESRPSGIKYLARKRFLTSDSHRDAPFWETTKVK